MTLILASQSRWRQALLKAAGVAFTAEAAYIDESAIIASMQHRKATPRDIADALAELKAAKISARFPDTHVIGSDQVLECEGKLFEKARTLSEARDTLRALRARQHRLISAAVIVRNGSPVWRAVDEATLKMRDFSDAFLETYLQQAGDIVTTSVGAYTIEGPGIQLFAQVRGDQFTIMGLPLLPLLQALRDQGLLTT
ncbi:MAG TPA: septum formation protein Maf [Alphaproteobacteria bacterium]|nr:septum formation protein Maf [Alphaproteobacteria bacterium]